MSQFHLENRSAPACQLQLQINRFSLQWSSSRTLVLDNPKWNFKFQILLLREVLKYLSVSSR